MMTLRFDVRLVLGDEVLVQRRDEGDVHGLSALTLNATTWRTSSRFY